MLRAAFSPARARWLPLLSRATASAASATTPTAAAIEAVGEGRHCAEPSVKSSYDATQSRLVVDAAAAIEASWLAAAQSPRRSNKSAALTPSTSNADSVLANVHTANGADLDNAAVALLRKVDLSMRLRYACSLLECCYPTAARYRRPPIFPTFDNELGALHALNLVLSSFDGKVPQELLHLSERTAALVNYIATFARLSVGLMAVYRKQVAARAVAAAPMVAQALQVCASAAAASLSARVGDSSQWPPDAPVGDGGTSISVILSLHWDGHVRVPPAGVSPAGVSAVPTTSSCSPGIPQLVTSPVQAVSLAAFVRRFFGSPGVFPRRTPSADAFAKELRQAPLEAACRRAVWSAAAVEVVCAESMAISRARNDSFIKKQKAAGQKVENALHYRLLNPVDDVPLACGVLATAAAASEELQLVPQFVPGPHIVQILLSSVGLLSETHYPDHVAAVGLTDAVNACCVPAVARRVAAEGPSISQELLALVSGHECSHGEAGPAALAGPWLLRMWAPPALVHVMLTQLRRRMAALTSPHFARNRLLNLVASMGACDPLVAALPPAAICSTSSEEPLAGESVLVATSARELTLIAVEALATGSFDGRHVNTTQLAADVVLQAARAIYSGTPAAAAAAATAHLQALEARLAQTCLKVTFQSLDVTRASHAVSGLASSAAASESVEFDNSAVTLSPLLHACDPTTSLPLLRQCVRLLATGILARGPLRSNEPLKMEATPLLPRVSVPHFHAAATIAMVFNEYIRLSAKSAERTSAGSSRGPYSWSAAELGELVSLSSALHLGMTAPVTRGTDPLAALPDAAIDAATLQCKVALLVLKRRVHMLLLHAMPLLAGRATPAVAAHAGVPSSSISQQQTLAVDAAAETSSLLRVHPVGTPRASNDQAVQVAAYSWLLAIRDRSGMLGDAARAAMLREAAAQLGRACTASDLLASAGDQLLAIRNLRECKVEGYAASPSVLCLGGIVLPTQTSASGLATASGLASPAELAAVQLTEDERCAAFRWCLDAIDVRMDSEGADVTQPSLELRLGGPGGSTQVRSQLHRLGTFLAALHGTPLSLAEGQQRLLQHLVFSAAPLLSVGEIVSCAWHAFQPRASCAWAPRWGTTAGALEWLGSAVADSQETAVPLNVSPTVDVPLTFPQACQLADLLASGSSEAAAGTAHTAVALTLSGIERRLCRSLSGLRFSEQHRSETERFQRAAAVATRAGTHDLSAALLRVCTVKETAPVTGNTFLAPSPPAPGVAAAQRKSPRIVPVALRAEPANATTFMQTSPSHDFKAKPADAPDTVAGGDICTYAWVDAARAASAASTARAAVQTRDVATGALSLTRAEGPQLPSTAEGRASRVQGKGEPRAPKQLWQDIAVLQGLTRASAMMIASVAKKRAAQPALARHSSQGIRGSEGPGHGPGAIATARAVAPSSPVNGTTSAAQASTAEEGGSSQHIAVSPAAVSDGAAHDTYAFGEAWEAAAAMASRDSAVPPPLVLDATTRCRPMWQKLVTAASRGKRAALMGGELR